MKLALIQRLHYPQGKEFDWRFNFWKENVLPALNNQTADFDHWIWCEPHHEHLFQELGINTFQVNHKTTFARNIHDYTDYKNVIGLPKYPIQVSIDSDDIPSEHLVSKVRELSKGDKNTLISFQPIKQDSRGNKYAMKNYKRRNKCAGIFAMYQPKEEFRWVYYSSHYRLPNDPYWDNIIWVGRGYVTVNVHGHNHSTKIKSEDKRL